MKKTPLLLATLLVTLGLLAYPRGARAGFRDVIGGIKTDLVLTDDAGETPPEPSIFDTLMSFSGKVTAISATPVGNYTCKQGTITIDAHTGFSRGLVQARELTEVSSSVDSLLLRGAPVKVAVATNAGIKTILIPAIEAERFKAVLAILHAARLTNKDVFFQVPTVSVPGCADAFYAADVELK
ncbi:MAG TPA: hypothetical protein VLJ37_09255 [bacterium]|nr:hypothetical protein [bacterium]